MSKESSGLILPVDHVSDTAWLVADLRRLESERTDAHFHDVLASKLLGKKGQEIRERIPSTMGFEFLMTVRTKVIDEIILKLADGGIDTVINLAAGLDTRPYRLNLPSKLQWIEADYKPVIAFKNQTLADDKPTCNLERISVDLADDHERQSVLSQLGKRGGRTLVLTEGLLGYLAEENVSALAKDLFAQSSFQWWMMDVMDPGMMSWFAKRMDKPKSNEKTTSLRFAPDSMAKFLSSFGWVSKEFHSFMVEGKRLNRLPNEDWPAEALATLDKSGIELFNRRS